MEVLVVRIQCSYQILLFMAFKFQITFSAPKFLKVIIHNWTKLKFTPEGRMNKGSTEQNNLSQVGRDIEPGSSSPQPKSLTTQPVRIWHVLTLTLFRYLPFLAYLIWNGRHQKWWFPPELIQGPLAHQSLEHPCQATPVTLPGQRFRTCMGPVSMT